MSVGTTKEGQKTIAEYYQVQDLWKNIAEPDCDFERYLNLLLLVKTKSQVDNLRVSFIEGLHWHAAMITYLLCKKMTILATKINQVLLIFKISKTPEFHISKILELLLMNS
jgi:hypothetical protein